MAQDEPAQLTAHVTSTFRLGARKSQMVCIDLDVTLDWVAPVRHLRVRPNVRTETLRHGCDEDRWLLMYGGR